MKTAQIFIYGLIGSDYSGITAANFAREFAALEAENDVINVRINSPGGSLFEGLAIANTVANSQKEIHTFNDGIAYSMAATILLSGKTVHAAKNSLIMIHNAQGGAYGHAQTLLEMSEDLLKYDAAVAQQIAEKTGKGLEQVLQEYFNYKDNLFTAAEALQHKFIDILEGESPAVPEEIQNMGYSQILNYYQDNKALKSNTNQGIFNRLFKSPQAKSLASGQTGQAEKIYTKEDLQIAAKVAAHTAEVKLLATVEALKGESNKWKQLAEEYGSQPGAMASKPVKKSDFNGSVHDPEALFKDEYNQVSKFRRK